MVLHVRELANEEGQRLSRLAKRTNNVVTLRRAQVLLHSAQGFTPPKIAELLGLTVEWVRHIINEFNASGFDSLKPKPAAGGRPRTFDDEIRLEIVNMALTPPPKLGYPFTQWSLRKLRTALIEKEVVADISVSNLQKVLTSEALSFQAVRTWKDSKDPSFVSKKKRIDGLTRKRHNPPVVISFDEMGPIELRPKGGRGWKRQGHPASVPATYTRKSGTRQFLCAFNYHHGTFFGRLRRRKLSKNILSFFIELRRHYPAEQRMYIIMDNLSAHWTPDIVEWARGNRVTLVPTPTNASWLNPIETHFNDMQKIALSGTDFRSWEEVGDALQKAIRYKNENRREMLDARDRRHKRKRLLWRLRKSGS